MVQRSVALVCSSSELRMNDCRYLNEFMDLYVVGLAHAMDTAIADAALRASADPSHKNMKWPNEPLHGKKNLSMKWSNGPLHGKGFP